LILKFFIFFPESFNTTRCVDEFLLAGKKWMAFGAYFNTDIGFGGADFYFIAACASYAGYIILRMNSLFHYNFNPLNNFTKLYFLGIHLFYRRVIHLSIRMLPFSLLLQNFSDKFSIDPINPPRLEPDHLPQFSKNNPQPEMCFFFRADELGIH
jgi:hypothetical protein